jgi:hypothetical protein
MGEATFILLAIHLVLNVSILIKLFKMDRD